MKMRKGYERRGAWLHQGMRLAKVKEIHDTQTDTARDRGTHRPLLRALDNIVWERKSRSEFNEKKNAKGGEERDTQWEGREKEGGEWGGGREKEGTEGGGITTHKLF